jgi:hypothetical protein
MPLFIFRMNVAEPQIALNAVHRRGKIARRLSSRNSLARPVGRFFVFGAA